MAEDTLGEILAQIQAAVDANPEGGVIERRVVGETHMENRVERIKYLLAHQALCFCDENKHALEIGKQLTRMRRVMPAREFKRLAETTGLTEWYVEFFMSRYYRIEGITPPAPKLVYDDKSPPKTKPSEISFSKAAGTVPSKPKWAVLLAQQNGKPLLDWRKRRAVNETMERLTEKLRVCTCDGTVATV